MVASRRGGVEGLRPSTNQWLAARGGSAVGIAPGRLAAGGGKRGMRGGEASLHPSTAYVLSNKLTPPSPARPHWGRESGSSPQRGEGGRGAAAPYALI